MVDEAHTYVQIRPISCKPLTRDRDNPANIGLNDALGNISLTLIDSLSTLAILASSSSGPDQRGEALFKFQEGVGLLVDYYGDGGIDSRGNGIRGRGFDVDSKVQVFETTIRGIGGLLSAHLFAVGDLPISGYHAKKRKPRQERQHLYQGTFDYEIEWDNGFFYSGQLLRLAQDLGERLLPAFFTPTGIPYPRVNLRYGIPFYSDSPLNQGLEYGQCQTDGPEITETCSAGAGSLILEFTALSRLTGDGRFEKAAKRAFHAVWSRRSSIGLVGSGIDAESGLWTSPYTGIGAGIDSFYEYAFKSHILLSGLETPTSQSQADARDPNRFFPPLSDEDHASDTFLSIWKTAHASIRRNILQELPHPHYINVHLDTGSPQIHWVDSLSAYYPGLLTLAGKLEEAIRAHLLYTALWTRYSALPERWSARTGNIEGGLSWWGGRPETPESNYYLYRATRDPWYLHVGSMIVSDIKRRCWTKCGFSGIQDVRSGELNDRMESFFLGETTKYLFLLFDHDHPLNSMDAPFVFTTEGHPLIVPRLLRGRTSRKAQSSDQAPNHEVCSLPPASIPFSVSATAARDDVFHAASFARLHLSPNSEIVESPLFETTRDHPSISLLDLQSPSNYTFYPWTLPLEILPLNGHSAKIRTKKTFDLQFPTTQGNNIFGQGAVRINEGILINSLAGLGIGLVRDETIEEGEQHEKYEVFRIHRMGNVPLGRDEKVFIGRDIIADMHDPNFSRVRDATMLDLVVDANDESKVNQSDVHKPSETRIVNVVPPNHGDKAAEILGLLGSLIGQIPLFKDPATGTPTSEESDQNKPLLLPAILSTGLGAIPPPDLEHDGQLESWTLIFASDESCGRLPDEVKRYQVIVMKRGGCSFSTKVASIPSSRNPPLVIVVSYEDEDEAEGSETWMTRPLMDQTQYTPSGLIRRHQISLVMVGGGQQTYDLLSHAGSISLKRRYQVHSQGVPVGNLIVL